MNDPVDTFIETVTYTVKEDKISYDIKNCAKTKRGIYQKPIFIEQDGEIYAYGVKVDEPGKRIVYISLNDEDISLSFSDDAGIYTNIYNYSEKYNRYDVVFGYLNKPLHYDDLVKPIVMIEYYKPYADRYLIIIKDHKVLRVMPDNDNKPYHKIRFSEDGNYLYVTDVDSYFVYDLSGSKAICVRKTQQVTAFPAPSILANNDESHFHLYYSQDNSKGSIVTNEYIRNNCDYKIVPNEFDDDETKVLDIIIPKDKIDTVGFLYSICPNNGRLVYECDPIAAYQVSLRTIEYYDYLKRQISDNQERAYRDVFSKFKEKMGLSDEETAIYIRDNYAFYYNRYPIYEYCVAKKIDFKKKGKVWKERYNEIYSDLVKNGQVISKWKSEADLFKLVKNTFSDAIYQYHNMGLLDMQSLDVFVPSERIAFEYQGRQHYEPIDFFGGEKAFIRRQMLDEKKKKICLDNKITLIEWKYDEPVNELVLKAKLAAVSRE